MSPRNPSHANATTFHAKRHHLLDLGARRPYHAFKVLLHALKEQMHEYDVR